MGRNRKVIDVFLVIARVLFGVTFIFSGFVKAVDPLGFTYKIEDYLISFHLTQFIPLALFVAVALILLEFLIGVFILLGLYRKLTIPAGALFMLVMTPLTLYIALENPVKDCGCFGDALIIDNWSTFYKNVVLLFSVIFLFVYRHKIKPFFSNKTKNYVLGFVVLFSLLFCLYNIIYLPIMDFRPYKVGMNIPEQMEKDANKRDVYKNIYICEKDGVEKEFTDQNYPADDSTWTFVEMKTELIKAAEEPLITEFFIIEYVKNSAGNFEEANDITETVLSNPLNLLVLSLLLDDAREEGVRDILALTDFVEKNGGAVHIVTSSEPTVIDKWHEKWGSPNVKYASMDELTLKTIIRSNPGLLLLNNGIIQAKWSSRCVPNSEKLSDSLNEIKSEEKTLQNNNSLTRLLIICAMFLLPLLGIKWYDMQD